MLLKIYDDVLELYRNNKKIYAKFLSPHRVISTCRINGGLREDIKVMLNHQSCEAKNHSHNSPMGGARRIITDPEAYLDEVCSEEGIDYRYCASLGTAANMHYASIQKLEFQDLWVLAVATGGVETNAGRAGDPAGYYEKGQNFINGSVKEKNLKPGTINIMVFINKPLTRGAIVRAIVTTTEAKTAALEELAVNSRYSSGLATGTGTDQIGIAARMSPEPALTSSGKHTKLGELIGKTVKAAVKETLALQNGLTPESQRSVRIHIERFGTDHQKMVKGICKHLDKETGRLFLDNFDSVNRDPMVVAAVAALVHLRDKAEYKILPRACLKEIYIRYSGYAAAAVSLKYEKTEQYIDKLSDNVSTTSDSAMLKLIYKALAMGFEDKWEKN